MRAGTIIRWNNFPEPRFDKEIKPRWFIYLGHTSSLESPIFLHLNTTTTRMEDFSRGGRRAGHRHCVLKASDTPFDRDCIIDLHEMPWPISEDQITGNPDIEFKGELGTEYLRKIYELALKSPVLSRKILLDMHQALNDIGMTGLKMPK